ncbi:MAG: hypothetical protein GX815_03615 [Clostridiales bacterium]|nr:hypothetical protein [Clostridiales bacterium]
MVDWISQFVSNIHNTQVVSLQNLIKGLLDLSSLAVGNQSQVSSMEKHNQEMQSLNNRILILESSLNQERNENQEIQSKLHELMDINKAYIELSDERKLTELNGYLSRLQTCIQG